MIWEIFRQERKGQPFEHAGSVNAPDAEFAEAWAREQYGRRGESRRARRFVSSTIGRTSSS